MRGFVGFGELGRQVDLLLTEYEGPRESKFFDDRMVERDVQGALPLDSCFDDEFRDCSFYVCLGYKHLARKAEIILRLLELGRRLPSFVHPSVYLSSSASVGAGTLVYPMCNVDKECVIGRGVVLNNSVVVSHNTAIGDCCYLAPGVVLSGFVTVGDRTFIGSGSVVSDRVSIGENVTVGIGTVVTRDVRSSTSVIGNPMRLLQRDLVL